MANFRSFTLYSFDRKEKVDLNSYNGYLVAAPRGLGIYLNNKYLSLGNKRILTEQKNAFESLSLTVDIFGATRKAIEKKYCDLRDFIARNRAGGFLLSYLPYDGEYEGVYAQERYIECDIKAFDKSEKATSRYMAIPLTVEPRSFWKVDVQTFSVYAFLSREFEFAEDQNVQSSIVVSNASGSYNGQQSDIPVTSSVGAYDKSTLPDDVKIRVVSDDFKPDAVLGDETPFVVSFTSADFSIQQDGKYYAITERGGGIDTSSKMPRGADVRFFCEFDVSEQKFGAGVCYTREVYDRTLEEGVDYDLNSYPTNVIRIEFDDDLVDDVCRINYRYKDRYDGQWNSSVRTKKRGEKVILLNSYLGVYTPLEIESIQKLDTEILQEFDGHNVSEYSWTIYADITKGKDNYFAPLLEDSGIVGEHYYCLPFGLGKSSAATINNDGDTEIPALLKINGASINPIVILSRKSDGETVQSTAINMTILADMYVEINSDPENTGAWLKGGQSGSVNVVSLLDIRTSMFITIPKGEFYIRAYDSSENPVAFSVSYGKEYFGA